MSLHIHHCPHAVRPGIYKWGLDQWYNFCQACERTWIPAPPLSKVRGMCLMCKYVLKFRVSSEFNFPGVSYSDSTCLKPGGFLLWTPSSFHSSCFSSFQKKSILLTHCVICILKYLNASAQDLKIKKAYQQWVLESFKIKQSIFRRKYM